MRDDLSTPEWREPPKRIGPIEDPLIDVIDRNAGAIAAAIAATILTIAAWLWGVDWLAGHL